LISFAETN